MEREKNILCNTSDSLASQAHVEDGMRKEIGSCQEYRQIACRENTSVKQRKGEKLLRDILKGKELLQISFSISLSVGPWKKF